MLGNALVDGRLLSARMNSHFSISCISSCFIYCDESDFHVPSRVNKPPFCVDSETTQ